MGRHHYKQIEVELLRKINSAVNAKELVNIFGHRSPAKKQKSKLPILGRTVAKASLADEMYYLAKKFKQ